jgi:hypothetical protein
VLGRDHALVGAVGFLTLFPVLHREPGHRRLAIDTVIVTVARAPGFSRSAA